MLKWICVGVMIIGNLLSFEEVGATQKGIFVWQGGLPIEGVVKSGETVTLNLVTYDVCPPEIELKIDGGQATTITTKSLKNNFCSKTYTHEYSLGEFGTVNSKIVVSTVPGTATAMYQHRFLVKGIYTKSWYSFRTAQVWLTTKEIRNVYMIRGIFPPRDITVDIPGKIHENFWGRFDINVGINANKGNDTSELNSSKMYFAGVSYELHKYFDFVGGVCLAEKDNGNARIPGFFGVSLDLSLFPEILQQITGK